MRGTGYQLIYALAISEIELKLHSHGKEAHARERRVGFDEERVVLYKTNAEDRKVHSHAAQCSSFGTHQRKLDDTMIPYLHLTFS